MKTLYMKNYICFVLLVVCTGCANIVAPSGGPKDVSPPKLIEAIPPNPSINFNKNKIILVFDEYVQIENIDNIQISPICEPQPEIRVRGKKIEIILGCKLDSLATYTINFGHTIVDVNENNILQNFKYVFSKNNQIDSLFIGGRVRELYSNKSIEKVMVGLFKNEDLEKPSYYTFSKDDQDFLIENIKIADYVLFAFLDENKNLKHDLGELASSPLMIESFNLNQNIGLFVPKLNNPILEVKNIYKNLVHFKHELLDDSIQIINATGFWKHSKKYSLFYFKETLDFIAYKYGSTLDSLKVYNNNPPEKLELNVTAELDKVGSKKCVWIETRSPIKNIISAKFLWESRKDSIFPVLVNPFLIKIPIPFNSNQNERLIINHGGIEDVYSLENDSLSVAIDLNQEKYGSINIRSSVANENLMIELFRGDNIIKSQNVSDSILLNWLDPGIYNIRVFIDENKNGFWDAGTITPSKSSEKIKIYPEVIKVRPNWEMDITITPP